MRGDFNRLTADLNANEARLAKRFGRGSRPPDIAYGELRQDLVALVDELAKIRSMRPDGDDLAKSISGSEMAVVEVIERIDARLLQSAEPNQFRLLVAAMN